MVRQITPAQQHTYLLGAKLVGRAADRGETAIPTTRARPAACDNNVAVQAVVGDHHGAGVDGAVVSVVQLVHAGVPEVGAVAVAPDVEADLDGLCGDGSEREGDGEF